MKDAPEIDFLNMWARIRRSGLQNELLIRAAKPERQRAAKGAGRTATDAADADTRLIEIDAADADTRLIAIDATAGLGEDAFLLAAAGYDVTMYERNPAVAEVLRAALSRAAAAESAEAADGLKYGGVENRFRDVIARMHLVEGDSAAAMRAMAAAPASRETAPGGAGSEPRTPAAGARIDVIYLDPMFPQDNKSALSRKKLQFIKAQQGAQAAVPADASPASGGVPGGLTTAADEEALLQAALALRPRKIIIKRPLKGPFLCGVTPGYSIKGKLIRYDCIVL